MSESNVFLVPCDPGNYDRTVRSPVDLTEYSDHPTPLSEFEEARFWGARDGDANRTYFKQMESGDLVLFYQDKTYIGVGYIGETFEDEAGWVRSTFWQNAPSKLIYTIEDFSVISVPREKVNSIFGYSDGYYPQGLSRVADKNVTNRVKAIKKAMEDVSSK